MEKKVVGRKSETSGHSIGIYSLSRFRKLSSISFFISLALRYEVAVQEEGGGAPSVAGVNKCFEMLGRCSESVMHIMKICDDIADELIPQLGMYQSVMNSLRQDLYSMLVIICP